MENRTIAAIATPLGEGGIGVIRISGEKAVEISGKIFSTVSGVPLSSLKGYSASYGQVVNNGNIIDDGVALVFKAPKSYTGEDVVEISLHGGNLILKQVLRLILDNGAFLSEPGEFTKRAFLNGKLDLTKAESVMGLISAHSDAELRLSRAAHIGKVSDKLSVIEGKLLETAASLSAYSDFPDEDIEGLDFDNFLRLLTDCGEDLKYMLDSYDAGRIIREGIETAIVGKPNVGKSTLMNMLSGAERSIVTDVAGTTRDIIEDTVIIGDIPLRLADTAGIHETDDIVESLGVQRAKTRIETADLILAVFDCTDSLDSNDISLLEAIKNRNSIVIINKSDLTGKIDKNTFNGFATVEISAKNGTGIDSLANEILNITKVSNLNPDSAVLGNERQRQCAVRAYSAITEASAALVDGCTLDAVGVCVDDAIAAVLELTGKRVTNEVTDEIFRRFCVGK